jgi:uncharacterized RDD family membrane protein YckC
MASIEIKTTQNVSIEYELASLWERGLATFIDLMIIGAGTILVPLVLSLIKVDRLVNSNLLYALCFLSFFFGYFFLMESLNNGQTLGKRVTQTRVVRLDGEIPTINDYLLRGVFHFLDTLFSIGILGAMLISSTASQQRMGDLTAGTTVIRKRSSRPIYLDGILNINTLNDYEPVYPQVRNLSEQDMLVIKQAVNRYMRLRNSAHEDLIVDLSLHLRDLLQIKETPISDMEFLRTLLRDYIVLTR